MSQTNETPQNGPETVRQWLVTAYPTLTLTVTAKNAQEATQQFLDLIEDDHPGITHHIEHQPEAEQTP